MAGIAGMANPSDIKPMEQNQEFDYTAWAEGQMKDVPSLSQTTPSTPAQQEFDYDAWAAQQVAQEPAQQEPSFYDRMTEGQGTIVQGISDVAYGAAKGLFTLPAAVGEAVATEIKTGKGDLGQSIVNAFTPSKETQDLRVSMQTIFPAGETAVPVKLPKVTVSMDEMDDLGRPKLNYSGESVEVNVKPNDILTIAADIAAGEAEFKAIGKGVKVLAPRIKALDETLSSWITARNTAKEAAQAENVAATTPIVDKAVEKAKDFANLTEELKQAGIIKNVEGFDTPIMRSQVTMAPIEQAEAADLAYMPQMHKFVEGQTQMLDDAANTVFKAVVPSYEHGGKAAEVSLKNLVKDVFKTEGEALGATRLEAMKIGKDYAVDATEVRTQLHAMAKELGYEMTPVTRVGDNPFAVVGGGKAPTYQEASVFKRPSRTTGIPGFTQQGARQLFDRIDKLENMLVKYTRPDGTTSLPYRELAKEYNDVFRDVKNLWDAGLNADMNLKLRMTGIKNVMQDAVDTGVSNILGPERAASYVASVEKYSKVKGAVKDLAKVTESDMGSLAMSRWLFQDAKSMSARERAFGLKNMLDLAGSPEAWDNIVNNYTYDMITKYTGRFGKERIVQWDKVIKEIENLDPEVQNLMFGKEVNIGLGYKKSGVDAFKDIADFFDMAQRGTPEVFTKMDKASQLKTVEAVKAMTSKQGALNYVTNKFFDKFIQADKDARVAKFLSQSGVDEVLKKVPREKRGAVQSFVDSYIKRANQWEQVRNTKPPSR